MSSCSENSYELSDSDVESLVAASALESRVALRVPDEGGVDYVFLTDSDTRSRSTHDMHMSFHNMTPSITSAAMTERSGISSHGVDTALRSHIDRNNGIMCALSVKLMGV